MGILPLVFQDGANAASLGLTGSEVFDVVGVASGLAPGVSIAVRARGEQTIEFQATARIDTPEELVAFRHGGILPYVLRQLVEKQ
jgi:aconitate hydratase